jgi:hypothetical protein
MGGMYRSKLALKFLLLGSVVICMMITFSRLDFYDGQRQDIATYTISTPNNSLPKSSKLLRFSTAWRQRNRVGSYLKDHTHSYALFKKVIHAENASAEFNLFSYVHSVVKTSIR